MGFPSDTPPGTTGLKAGLTYTQAFCSHVPGWIPGTFPQRPLQHAGMHFSPARTGA